MAVSIKSLHDAINYFVEDNNLGFIIPEDKDDAINFASKQLFNFLVSIYRKTGDIPDLLETFKTEASLSPSSGSVALPAGFAELDSFLAISGSKEYPGIVKKTEKEFNSRKLVDIAVDEEKPNEPLHWYEQQATIAVGSFTSGKTDLPSNFLDILSVNLLGTDGVEYDYPVVSSKDWANKSFLRLLRNGELPDEEKHWYEQLTEYTTGDVTNNQVLLPDNFVKANSVYLKDTNGQIYDWRLVDSETFTSKKTKDLYEGDEETNNDIHWFEKTVTYSNASFTNGKADLPTDFVEPVSIHTLKDGKNYEGFIIKSEDWNKRNRMNVRESDDSPRPNQLIRTSQQITTVVGIADVPDDYNEVIALSVLDDCSVERKATEVTEEAFLAALDDEITPPSIEKPIFYIADDQIRVLPKRVNRTDTIVKLYYYKRPNEKALNARIIGNQIEIDPVVDASYSVIFNYRAYPVRQRGIANVYGKYLRFYPAITATDTLVLMNYQFPVKERGQSRIYNDQLEVQPAPSVGESVIMNYIEYPSIRRPIAIVRNGTFYVAPSSITSVKVQYLAKPTDGEFAYTNPSGDNVVYDSGNSTDLDWDEMAFPELLKRACGYLSVPLDDAALSSFMGSEEQVEQSKKMVELNAARS